MIDDAAFYKDLYERSQSIIELCEATMKENKKEINSLKNEIKIAKGMKEILGDDYYTTQLKLNDNKDDTKQSTDINTSNIETNKSLTNDNNNDTTLSNDKNDDTKLPNNIEDDSKKGNNDDTKSPNHDSSMKN